MKKKTSLGLTEEALRMLRELALSDGCSMQDIVERLIRREFRAKFTEPYFRHGDSHNA